MTGLYTICFVMLAVIYVCDSWESIGLTSSLHHIHLLWLPYVYVAAQFFTATPEIILKWNFLHCFMMAIAVGFWEEVAFRGFIFGHMLKRTKMVHLSAIVSSILFGLMHIVNLTHTPGASTWSQVIYTMLFGFGLCGVYYQTGNIVPIIIMHALFDFFAFLGMSSAASIYTFTQFAHSAFYMMPLFFYGLLLMEDKPSKGTLFA
jgi:membrane protease YdiL (CAAX protease family)